MPGKVPDPQTPVVPHYPIHLFASPSSDGINPATMRPHVCMQDVEQQGNYIHCKTGSHGMRLAPDEILEKDANGQFIISKVVVRDRYGNPVVANDANAKKLPKRKNA